MTRTDPKLEAVELSATITQSDDDQMHDAPHFWTPTLAGEEDPFFDVEPSVMIGAAYAYPTPSSGRHRRLANRDRQ